MTLRQIRKWLNRGIGISTLAVCSAMATNVMAESPQRLIVKFNDDNLSNAQVNRTQDMQQRLANITGVSIEHLREMGLSKRHVFALKNRSSHMQFDAMLYALKQHPDIIDVEEDVLMQPNLVPDDTFYPNQWHYFEATGGMNAELAWDTHDGTGVVVAVLDTGITDHSDLNANILPGYDFIDDLAVANDGDGRDSDASDPGDWVAAFECGFNGAQNSSWHGTHVAGTIAALTDNGQGVAGVAYGAQVVPVRVLGKCGGFLSDIADAIVWASGGNVTGVPANANPAQVINMSLGGFGACGTTYQDAIDIAVANGTTVVVSAGNSDADAIDYRPASCNNVINVAANDRNGDKAWYSNFGSIIDVTAPGGDTTVAEDGVASTLNDGTEGPGAEAYAYYQGTSMAAPHVAGVAALLYQANPAITPAEVESILMSTARPLPGSCTGGCGSGIIDARAALDAIDGSNPAPTSAFSYSTADLEVTFTDESSDNSAVVSWSWDFGDGGSSTAQNPVYTYGVAGTYTVSLTVTDDEGATNSSSQNVTVTEGGGSNTGGWTENNLSPGAGEILSYTIDVPAGASALDVTTSGGTGNVDLVIRFGSAPTRFQNDCIQTGAGNEHTCSISDPDDGTWFIAVRGAIASSGVQLDAYWTMPGGNQAPTSDFSVATNLLEATFTDASSDTDGSIVSWSWDFGDGNSSNLANPVNVYAASGTYDVTLTVTDDEGATDSSTQSVTVTDGSSNSGGFTETDISASAGEVLSYTIDVPAGATVLEIDTFGGTGNVDLAINFGSAPSISSNDCIQIAAGNTHNCTINNPQAGTWFIAVRGAAVSSGVTLEAYWTQ